MTPKQLQQLLWPAGADRWELVPDRQLIALEKLVVVLLERAEAGYLGAAQVGRVQRLVAETQLELRIVEVQIDPTGDQGSESLWVLSEPIDDRRGRGSYVFRLGALEPGRRGRVEHLLQAPHSRYDKYTGKIAVGLFLERDLGVQPPRALFLNSAHRYRQFGGARMRLVPASRNPADAAHQPEHPLARVTALALRKRPLALIQLHGFGRKIELGDPDVIVSSGTPRPSEASEGTLRRLHEAFAALPMSHFGVETDRLGGETNVQGRAARSAGRCFVHIETSEPLRKQLLDDRETRRRFAVALFGADREELRHGCK